MAMFGSENPGMMAGGGSMDPMMLEAMMKNMPELKARQRRAEMLRGLGDQFKAQAADTGSPNNFVGQSVDGGLFNTIQQYTPDYSQIGKSVTGALGGYATDKAAETAQGSADEMLAQQGLGVAQAFGGGNTGGRMSPGMMGNGIGPGLSAAQTAPQQGGVIPGAPGATAGSGPNPIGQMRQNYGMANKGSNALANLSRWFGQ